jgi:DNA polymerase-3 subunit delta
MKGANGQLPKLRPDVRLYLFHGGDEVGAADLARRLAATQPDAERVDIEPATLKKEPGRMADEALSPSLFGDARIIRAGPLGDDALEAVSMLLDATVGGSPVIAVGPSLKRTSKLLKLATDHPRALAIACYPPSTADAERLATGLLAEAGLRPAAGVARRLAEASGGDRAVLAAEIEKLALYLDAAPERPRDAGGEALDAIGADLGEAELGEAIDALLDGRAGELGARLRVLDEGGASAVPWLRALQRRLVALGDMRGAVDRGEPIEQVIKRNRIHFREEQRTTRDLRRWLPGMVATALTKVRDAELAAMSSGPGAVLAEQSLVTLARRVVR